MKSKKNELNKDLLDFGLQPKKYLGQNFLISAEALSDIIDLARVSPSDLVLEVGPGTGLLTEKLLSSGAKVLAIEKDRELYELLANKYKQKLAEGKLVLINEDFLKIDFTTVLRENDFQPGKYKVVANLPYQITSPFFERVLERDFLPSLMVLTLQKEVAEKISIEKGKNNSLGVLAHLCAEKITLEKIFPPHFFYPQPKVSSALLLISGLEYPQGIKIKEARKIIQAGFSARRRKLIGNFKRTFPLRLEEIELAWKELGISDLARAEELGSKEWLQLIKFLSKK